MNRVKLTIGARHGPRPAYWTNSAWVCAVRKSEPVRRVGLKVRHLDFHREIDVVARECLAGRYGPT